MNTYLKRVALIAALAGAVVGTAETSAQEKDPQGMMQGMTGVMAAGAHCPYGPELKQMSVQLGAWYLERMAAHYAGVSRDQILRDMGLLADQFWQQKLRQKDASAFCARFAAFLDEIGSRR